MCYLELICNTKENQYMGKDLLTQKEVRTLKQICRLFLQSDHQKVNVKALVSSKIAFTDRELLIIRLTCQEYKSSEIADKLSLNERTVEKSKTGIFRKAGVNSSMGLMKFALKHGLYRI